MSKPHRAVPKRPLNMRNFFLSLTCFLLTSGIEAFGVEAVLRDDISVSTRPGAPLPNGKADSLRISETDYVFLRFEFDSVLPEGTTANQIAKASLRLWCAGGRNGGVCSVSPVRGIWSEAKNGISAKALPAIAAAPTTTGGVDQPQSFMILDVTELVREWVSGTPNWGLRIRGAFFSGPDGAIPPMNLFFDSKENRSTGHLPTLQIVLRP
ncbi:MAG: DNRLRE domain-containing protein [Chthoniobacteraceae bacterium]